MTTRRGTRLIWLALLFALISRELARFILGLVLLVLLIALMGCAPAATPQVAFLSPPCVVEPAPRVPPGNSDRAAALYIERLYAWGMTGWACVRAQQVTHEGGAGDL